MSVETISWLLSHHVVHFNLLVSELSITIRLGSLRLSRVQTLDRGRLVDLKVVLILFVVLKDQVHVVVIVAHVSKHLEDLL